MLMGCDTYKVSDNVNLQDLAPNRQHPSLELDLDIHLLNTALNHMAHDLTNTRQEVVVIGVGGATNVMFLRSRISHIS